MRVDVMPPGGKEEGLADVGEIGKGREGVCGGGGGGGRGLEKAIQYNSAPKYLRH